MQGPEHVQKCSLPEQWRGEWSAVRWTLVGLCPDRVGRSVSLPRAFRTTELIGMSVDERSRWAFEKAAEARWRLQAGECKEAVRIIVEDKGDPAVAKVADAVEEDDSGATRGKLEACEAEAERGW